MSVQSVQNSPNPTPLPAARPAAAKAVAARTSTVAQAPAPPKRESRMTLESITTGSDDGPLRIVGYAPEGTGKTTLAACSPSPVFMCPEDGLENLPHVKRFPTPHDFRDVLDGIQLLIDRPTDRKTFVLDTADWVEPLIWAHTCAIGNDKGIKQKSIEDFGYGKGYNKALDHWRVMLSLLDRLSKTRGMNIIILAHSHIKTWKNPSGDDFDRYQLKVNDKAAGLLKEWPSCLLFMNEEMFASKADDDKRSKAKGFSTGERFIFTRRCAAFDAKNRFALPERIPLDWDAFEAAVAAGRQPTAVAITNEIDHYLGIVNDASVTERVRAAIAKAPDDPARLTRINEQLKTMIPSAEGADVPQGE